MNEENIVKIKISSGVAIIESMPENIQILLVDEDVGESTIYQKKGGQIIAIEIKVSDE
jgi:hypothetical protein